VPVNNVRLLHCLLVLAHALKGPFFRKMMMAITGKVKNRTVMPLDHKLSALAAMVIRASALMFQLRI
jgi:hypothetical protein